MAGRLQAGNPLKSEDWLCLRERAIFEFCKWDVQCEDHSVLASFPLLLDRETAEFLNETAEALYKEALEAEVEILRRPEFLERLGLPRLIRKVLQRNCPSIPAGARVVRVMRFDFHPTADGWRISEVNADVPGGFVEASGWNSLFAEKHAGAVAPPAPSEAYASAILDIAGTKGLIAFVHATAYSDDRQVMHHLARYFSRLGLRVCLLSPAHLRWQQGLAEIRSAFASGRPDAIVRFFPAEWLPNLSEESCWHPYFQVTKPAMSNPASAIVLQSKRFPLLWDQLAVDLPTWRKTLPETREPVESYLAFDGSWVLKPALGRVGEGIGMRGVTPQEDLLRLTKEARSHPQEWVIQKRFDTLPVRTEVGAKYPCIGVFTIDGKAAGFYGRIADTPIINQNAQDVAVLIQSHPLGKSI